MNAVQDMEASEVRRVIASRLEEVDGLCGEIRVLCRERGWTSLGFGLELVLRECLNNAILHGNARDPAKRVEMTLVNRPPWIRVQVTDEGAGFDWRAIRGRSLPEGDAPGGRGLPITARYARRVRFNPRGNQITVWFQQVPKPNSSDL